MGFYITEQTRNRARRAAETPWGPKPLRGPIFHNAISGHRFYNPDLGRWVSRDPIGERGGLNLYIFILNRAPITVDKLGLIDLCSIVGCCDRCEEDDDP